MIIDFILSDIDYEQLIIENSVYVELEASNVPLPSDICFACNFSSCNDHVNHFYVRVSFEVVTLCHDNMAGIQTCILKLSIYDKF